MSQPFEIVDPDVDARRKERAIEYGTWECGEQPIEFGGARAFNEGDPVPKSTVERFGLDQLGAVVKSGTFSKKSAAAEAARVKAAEQAIRDNLKAVAKPRAKPADDNVTAADAAGSAVAAKGGNG